MEISLETCILEKLKPNPDQPEETVVPWLQILAALIDTLDKEALEGLENLILERMQCCRKPEVKALLMKCAQNLLQRLE